MQAQYNRKHHHKSEKNTCMPPCIDTNLPTKIKTKISPLDNTSATRVAFREFIELTNLNSIKVFITTAVRGLPIPDPHQKTTPLHTSSLRDVRTPSLEITKSCQPSPAVGQLLIYSLSYHFIIYYGSICYISPPYSVLVYIPLPLQRSPFFPLRIPARSVSTLYFTFLLQVIILSSSLLA